MKKMILSVLMLAATVANAATPYVYIPFTVTQTYPNGAPLPISTGLLYDSKFASNMSFTNAAVLYHPASSGSFIDRLFPTIAKYVPAESWAVNLGFGGTGGNYVGGPGFSLNLLDTFRQELAAGLNATGNATAGSFASVLAPKPTDSVLMAFGPQWTAPLMNGGAIPPLNQLRVTNHWYFGLGWAFGGSAPVAAPTPVPPVTAAP